MKIRTLALLLMTSSALTALPLSAQQAATKVPTLSQYTLGSPDALVRTGRQALRWLGSGYIYTDGTRLVYGTPGTKLTEKTLITAPDLIALIGEAVMGRDVKKFPASQVVGRERNMLSIALGGKYYIVDPVSKKLLYSFERAEEQAFELSPDLKHGISVRDNNLYLLLPDGTSSRLTEDGSPTIVYGRSVHQNEFGITGGLFWSPDGTKLAFYRMDQSMVKPYPLVHTNTRKATREDLYYPMAGMPSHHVTLGVYDLATGKTTYMQTGEPKEKYLTNISWAPDGKTIYIAEVNREQTDMALKAYNPLTGAEVRTLFTEHDDRYTEPQWPMYFVPGKPNEFVWMTRRNGFGHLYHYNTEGKLLNQITRGQWEVVDFLGFADKGKTVLFTSTEHSPIDRVIARASLDGKSHKLLTGDGGWHQPTLSPDGKWLLDNHQSLKETLENRLVSSATGKHQLIYRSVDPEADYARPEITFGTIKAADGKTDLYYRLLKPLNFDPAKKYPTIVYVYNGPHAQLVQNRFHAGCLGWDLYMATQGYVVFTVDGRGSNYRGLEFEQVIHRHLGKHEMDDQMEGVKFLKSLPYVDADRMGVAGWSYGGFMTTSLMLKYPETFKVGVAGGAVTDWSRYEIMYGERYMDTPQENPEGYRETNLPLRAKDLKGRLLLIHGTIDPTVVWQHTQLFVQACVKAGTHPDYMIYPEHQHNVLGPDRVHLNYTMARFFDDHLK